MILTSPRPIIALMSAFEIGDLKFLSTLIWHPFLLEIQNLRFKIPNLNHHSSPITTRRGTSRALKILWVRKIWIENFDSTIILTTDYWLLQLKCVRSLPLKSIEGPPKWKPSKWTIQVLSFGIFGELFNGAAFAFATHYSRRAWLNKH